MCCLLKELSIAGESRVESRDECAALTQGPYREGPSICIHSYDSGSAFQQGRWVIALSSVVARPSVAAFARAVGNRRIAMTMDERRTGAFCLFSCLACMGSAQGIPRLFATVSRQPARCVVH